MKKEPEELGFVGSYQKKKKTTMFRIEVIVITVKVRRVTLELTDKSNLFWHD